MLSINDSLLLLISLKYISDHHHDCSGYEPAAARLFTFQQ